MFCVETNNLSYAFPGSGTVLNNISLQIPYGSIFGFLGPNGAGKTTTLKLLLGLLKRQSGTIKLFEKNPEESRIEILKNTGSLIETPSLYSNLTAAENLKVLQLIYRCPESRIGEILEVVGLADTGKKTAGEFSLGMKQRLGIAIALLHNPSLLILDEPVNGLDPNGIIEIRELLIKLNSEYKTTILISSHLLSEIEKLVTHICIINKGNVLFQGTREQLNLKQNQSSYICFDTGNNELTIEILRANKLNPLSIDNGIAIPVVGREVVAYINQQLVNNKIEVYQIHEIRNNLESIFMNITKTDK